MLQTGPGNDCDVMSLQSFLQAIEKVFEVRKRMAMQQSHRRKHKLNDVVVGGSAAFHDA
jgi:hypothetical protein